MWGKPRWRWLQFRILLIFTFLSIPLYGFWYLQSQGVIPVPDLVFFLMAVVWFFYYISSLALHQRRAGLRFWQTNATLLENLSEVPCPNCCYQLCRVEDADGEHVCSECGRGINGIDAMRAWDSVRVYRRPGSWNRWLKED